MLLVWSAVFLLGLVRAADVDKKIEEAENLVLALSKKTDVDIKKSFRCGMFFPDPKDPAGLPAAPLLIFNSSWPAADCPDSPDYDKYNDFCNEIFRKFTTTLTLSDPSLRKDRREQGGTIGSDICRYIKEKVKAPFVGGRRSKKFPTGLDIAMYSNACGDKIWTNAGEVHSEKLCCVAGKHVDCGDLL